VQIEVASTFKVSADQVWDTLQKASTLEFVARGVISYKNVANFPEYWQVGTRINVLPVLFRVLPQGDYWVEFVEIDQANMVIKTQEESPSIKLWNHTMVVRPVSDFVCEYTDIIEIDAGRKTALVAGFARFFYRHRHKRWLKLLT